MTPEQYLATIIAPLVSHSEDVFIDNSADDRGILLTITLNKEDMGPVIGKDGETARSIRRLVRQFGMSRKAHIAVKINEPKAE